MSNKIVVLLSTIFPARPKQSNVTCRPAIIPTLGSQIGTVKQEREPGDYSHMFDECRRIFAGR